MSNIVPQPQANQPSLKTTKVDLGAALARGVVGACPVVGNLLSEVVSQIIPNQKLDRVITWVKLLDQRVATTETDFSRFSERIRAQPGSDLFEEAAQQASRALSDERREHLANLLARSLTQEELNYAESKKLLNLLHGLTDPEIILLTFYARLPSRASPWHSDMVSRYPEILHQVRSCKGSLQSEINREAIQTSYRETLVRLGLLQPRQRALSLTSLGRLLLSYIQPQDVRVPQKS